MSLIKPSRRGLLHKELGVPMGQKIPAEVLRAADAHAKKEHNDKMLKQINFAKNFGK